MHCWKHPKMLLIAAICSICVAYPKPDLEWYGQPDRPASYYVINGSNDTPWRPEPHIDHGGHGTSVPSSSQYILSGALRSA